MTRPSENNLATPDQCPAHPEPIGETVIDILNVVEAKDAHIIQTKADLVL